MDKQAKPTTSEARSTPMPWKAEILAESVLRLEGPDSYSFQCPVEIIVRAVNSHDALVDTLRLVTELKDAADLPALIRHCKRVLENLEVPTIATKFLAPSNRKIGGQGND
jgi:hypothetical protein